MGGYSQEKNAYNELVSNVPAGKTPVFCIPCGCSRTDNGYAAAVLSVQSPIFTASMIQNKNYLVDINAPTLSTYNGRFIIGYK